MFLQGLPLFYNSTTANEINNKIYTFIAYDWCSAIDVVNGEITSMTQKAYISLSTIPHKKLNINNLIVRRGLGRHNKRYETEYNISINKRKTKVMEHND